MICPFISAGSERDQQCRKQDCALWVQLENKDRSSGQNKVVEACAFAFTAVKPGDGNWHLKGSEN